MEIYGLDLNSSEPSPMAEAMTQALAHEVRPFNLGTVTTYVYERIRDRDMLGVECSAFYGVEVKVPIPDICPQHLNGVDAGRQMGSQAGKYFASIKEAAPPNCILGEN